MPPPPPPPPTGPGVPVFKNLNPRKNDKPLDTRPLEDLITEKQPEMDPIVPVRPKTPPPRGPETHYDARFAAVSTTHLFNMLQFGSRLLVVDARDKEAFDELHIRSAVSWDCKKAQSLLEEEEKSPRLAYRRTYKVIIYDDAGSLQEPSERLQAAKDIISEERLCEQEVLLLEGGLDAFKKKYPFLVKGLDSFTDAEYPSEILEEKLYLGSWATASQRRVLDDLEIQSVVNATLTCGCPFEDELEYVHCPIDDAADQDLSEHFHSCISFVEEAFANNKRVLIHCKMGMSRSSALVLLWLMHSEKMTLKQAFDYVQKERPYINPNPAFLLQLKSFEEELHGEATIRFPDLTQPLSMSTPYEWRMPDGSWVARVVIR